jgi:Uma2 family endonuclease
VVRIQGPLLAADKSEPEPDVAVVAPGDDARSHPDQAFLVIEVADSSLEYDRHTKGPLYAASGVPEYWIINLVEGVIEVQTAPGMAGYTDLGRVTPGQTLSPVAFPDLVLDASTLLP